MIERAWSPTDVERAKFNELDFEGEWLEAIGKPERTGTWIIKGPSKNGKTSFAMMLAKYLTNFGRVYYNSIEEGLSKSIKMAYNRVNMFEVNGKIILYKEDIKDMDKRLSRHKSPDFIFVDTIQFASMTIKEYKELKKKYPNKIFIYVSHVKGSLPDGRAAEFIMKDSNVIAHVEGRRAFFTTRYEGNGIIDIDAEYANNYWQGQSK